MSETQNKPNKWGLSQLISIYNDYPRQFWVLVFSTFIDRLGGSLLFPFFSLYITKKFNVGMTEVGIVFAIFSITGIFSGLLGGALTDRIGRKGILIFGLIMSASSTLVMGFIDSFTVFLIGAACIGLLADVGWPAQQTMVADLLPEEKRAQGYGIIRVIFNLAVVIGPILGGLLAARSYMLLFIIDAITSSITALIVFIAIKETKQAKAPGEQPESVSQTFKGYFTVLRDSAFMWFMVASMLSVIVYMQMNTTLAVYLRDVHGLPEQMFGYILSLNAAMVVLFQFPITRGISKYRPLNIMVIGTLFYALGFAMYGYFANFPLFLFAMAVITIGEMLVSPVAQSIVSSLAPEEMRGRYMAAFGFSWVLPSTVGPLLAGLIMDNLDPRWLWYSVGVIGLISAAGFYLLEQRIGRSRWAAVDKRLDILEKLEKDQITAEEAAALLAELGEDKYQRLAPKPDTVKQGQLHIRVSDSASDATQKELVLPLGLINIIQHTDCRLSNDLETYLNAQQIRTLIAHGLSSGLATQSAGSNRVDISTE
jgi:MFS family permease